MVAIKYAGARKTMPPTRRAFTLIELIAVIAVLGILMLVAMPRFFDWRTQSKSAAADGSIAGITTALEMMYVRNRMVDADSGEWVLAVNDVARTMNTGQLPEGVTIAEGLLVDHEGQQFTLVPETATSPAALTLAP
jgi:prepilin-type N-terminal cleavage/methylation domain-containing protein